MCFNESRFGDVKMVANFTIIRSSPNVDVDVD
jgi:hypothetical protein